MLYVYLAIAVAIIFGAMYFINKKTFIMWIVKLVEIIGVIAIGYEVSLLVKIITKVNYMDIAAISVVFYFFGGIIRPYMVELQEMILEYFNKDKK